MSETFDLMAFIDGSSYPKKSVTIYTNVAAMQKREELLTVVTLTGDSLEEMNKAEDEIAAIEDDIKKSGVTFELQGMPFQVAKAIANIFAEDDAEDAPKEDDILELVQKSIVGVTDSNGAVSSIPTVEQLKKIHGRISPLEFNKLIETAVSVSFSAAQYEAEIDAGFPVGSPDVE